MATLRSVPETVSYILRCLGERPGISAEHIAERHGVSKLTGEPVVIVVARRYDGYTVQTVDMHYPHFSYGKYRLEEGEARALFFKRCHYLYQNGHTMALPA